MGAPPQGPSEDENGNHCANGITVAPAHPKPTNEHVLNFAFYSFIGFVAFQAIFALIANSEAMLADSEAMSVDAMTYLFNLCAERIKNRPFSEKELQMSPVERDYKRELQRLYLELIPPSVSVATLIFVTILTLREAFPTLSGRGPDDDDDDEDVSITIMLLFSSGNLLLDVVNVTCFARADSAFGIDVVRREGASIKATIRESWTGDGDFVPTEATNLLNDSDADEVEMGGISRPYANGGGSDRISSSRLTPRQPHVLVNLNMCSAWTHVCADTLRSVAVLVAAAIAYLFPTDIDPATADAVAAVAVSIIIFASLIPLFQGLVLTALEIFSLSRNRPVEEY